MVEQVFSDGEFIFRAGDAADGVYRIRSGSVRAVWPHDQATSPAAVYLSGDILGERGFLLGDERPYGAVAEGDVVVDFLRRNEILRLLSESRETLAPLVAELFGPLVQAAPAPQACPDTEPDTVMANGSRVQIRLVPDGKRVRAAVGADEIPVSQLPFCIGRTAFGEGMSTYHDVHLALDDARPFSLSRRHFSIDREDDSLIVRDHGSYHGTTVNGLMLGGEGRPRTARLMTGVNELVAGKPDSPFRFRILVD